MCDYLRQDARPFVLRDSWCCVQLVGFYADQVVVIREVAGGGGHAKVVAGREVHALYGEAWRPRPLVEQVVAHGQLVVLIPERMGLIIISKCFP